MSQHDYVISNGTGGAVRSDLNSALGAIATNNSGATAPATTYAYQWWADTTTNTLKLRNGSNSAWIELRQLDGDFTTVSVDNGSAAAPAIYFNASGTDTGIYSSGTDALDFATAGTRKFGIASGGDLTVYGGNFTLNAQGDLRFADSDSSNWVAFQSPATVASNVTWTLPSADGTASQMLSTDGSGVLSWATPDTAPAGTVIWMASTTVPTGYVKANGAAISRSTYSALFSAIGTTFGSGNGTTTFNVPDLRGEFIRGWDESRGIDTSRSFGSAQSDELESHNHTISPSTLVGRGGAFSATAGSQPLSEETVTIGSTGGSETRPRNIALMAIIKY